MRKTDLSQWKILLPLTFFILNNTTSVHAATAISAPAAAGRAIESAKNEYRGIEGRIKRWERRTKLAEQVAKAKEALEVSEKEYEQIKSRREQLIASFEKSGIAKEKYEEISDVKQAYEAENSHLKRMEVLKGNYEKAILNQQKFMDTLKNLPVYASFYTGAKSYNWKDKEGDTGHKFLIPVGTWMGNRAHSIGIYGNYVFAENNSSNAKGSESTLTDISLGLTRGIELSAKEDIEYTLGINLPTGNNALDFKERNASMSDDLVELDKFGSAWKVRPGVRYSWRPHKHDKWTIGTSYVFARYYNPTSDIPNDDSKAGREWEKFIRYQHAKEKQQFIAELQHTDYHRSFNENGSYYDTDDEWIIKLTYNKRIAKHQELALFYWPEYQTSASDHPLSEAAWVHHYGVRWSKFMDPQNTLRASFTVLQTDGPRYNGLRSDYDDFGNPKSYYTQVAGRDKYTFGLGYDHYFKNRSRISLDVRYFWMHDGESNFKNEPATRYKGLNVWLMYTKSATFHW